MLKPNTENLVESKQFKQVAKFKGRRMVSFNEGENVNVQDYRANHGKWQPAVVSEKFGSQYYTVQTADGLTWKRHANQILPNPSPACDDVSPTTLNTTPRVSPNFPSQHSPLVAESPKARPKRDVKPPKRVSHSVYENLTRLMFIFIFLYSRIMLIRM